MHKYLAVIVNDLKNTKRDATLLIIFFVPFLILAVVKIGLPILAGYFPQTSNYFHIIVSFFVLLNAIFPGFILSFIILDEKDLKLLPVIKVTPVSLSGFLVSRIAFMLIFGLMGSLLLLFFNGVVSYTIQQSLCIALLCALNTPILVLVISTLAKNKVEGLTLLKVANVTLFIPVVLFFLNSPWENLLAVFPAYWVYQFVDAGYNANYIFVIGVIVLTIYNYIAFKYALRKLF